MVLTNLAYFQILDKPLIFYLGIFTLTSFLITASIPFLNQKKLASIPFKYHPLMAKISISLAIIHGLLAVSIYL